MDKIIISGNSKLFGSIKVNGSKNAALPILAASLLSDKILQLTNLLIKTAYRFNYECTRHIGT